MRLPNLFATSRGRLAAFFFLYMTEGIPLGFAATAVATQLRRQGVGPAEIGAFVGSFYLPWAFKWAFGPIIDVFASERLGRRRGWILGTQLIMVGTLLSLLALKLPDQLALFTIILLVHNTFAAMQDVAIDALAVNTLKENERGTANGMMFAGANVGQMIGGSGSLFLAGYFGFQSTFFFVSACILAVTALVVLPLKEAASPARIKAAGSAMAAAFAEMRDFSVTAFRSFLGTRGAFAGLAMSLLPPGAMCLGLALQSNLAVELGMNDDQIAWLNMLSTICGAGGNLLGGYISDRWGRRRSLGIYIALMSLPVLVMMAILQQHGWIMPMAEGSASRPTVTPFLINAYWAAVLSYGVFQGLMYSAATALYMDVTNPRVAGTQFTAYMAMFNLTISYSATWQGIAIESVGYPKTMLIDAFFGLLFISLLPFTQRRASDPAGFSDHHASGRARKLALGLAAVNLLWVPLFANQALLGAALPIAQIFYSLIFIGSALFLLAGGMVLRESHPVLARWGKWFAPLLLLMVARNHLDTLAGWLGQTEATLQSSSAPFFYAVPVLAAVLLLQLAREHWQALAQLDADDTSDADLASRGAV
ncbi:MFS transporter [Ideonella azotifigens]|uniref:MFS transporter n=1 Tax=Ideonella azotifigens TaxID=513160 RepID=A0ABP3VCV0_9BURK|nr:MFS transporter [Ideonella azotifigens]MCD2342398.1 MFS transporter [Ideonella azotifigens]